MTPRLLRPGARSSPDEVSSEKASLDPARIAEITGGTWVREPDPDRPILGASIDTRTLAPGAIFFAFPGEHADGHDYLSTAAARGASLAIVERAIDPPTVLSAAQALNGFGILRVESSRAALLALGRAYRADLEGVAVVGVTGSNGKTTTVRMIDAACRGGGLVGTHAQKSQNNDLGVPLTILNARPTDDYLICEIGTSSPGEIGALADLTSPSIAVITSIGRAHIERLGSVEGIALEKADLVRGVRPGGLAVITPDSPELDAQINEMRSEKNAPRIVRAGLDRAAKPAADQQGEQADSATDLRARAYRADRGGSSFEIAGTAVRLPLPGAHNAANAALAVAVARELGVAIPDACAGLGSMTPPEMRLQRIAIEFPSGAATLINDAYNANAESVLAALTMLGHGELDPPTNLAADPAAPAPRRVAVLGEMLEMGDATASVHREVGAFALSNPGIGLVLFVGAGFRSVGADLRSSGIEPQPDRPTWTSDDADWPAEVSRMIEPGDVVLIKGSRGVRMERLVDAVRERAGSPSPPAQGTPAR